MELGHVLEPTGRQETADVLLLQETKLSDVDAPVMPFGMLGYELVHHGEGRWNGVGILSRVGASDVVANFGDGPVRDSTSGAVAAVEDDFDPFREARMVSAVCGGVRVVCVYVPNGQAVDSDKYQYKLNWLNALRDWLREEIKQHPRLALLGDYNIAPEDRDVYDPQAWQGNVLVSEPERDAFRALEQLGLRDAFRDLPIPSMVKPAIGGLGVGVVARQFPQVLGVGSGGVLCAVAERVFDIEQVAVPAYRRLYEAMS